MKFIMLVGCSGSGKSTLAAELRAHDPSLVIISPDTVLEELATAYDVSYQEAYNRFGAQAEDICWQTAGMAFSMGYNTVWDQTNLMKSIRETRLDLVPDSYDKIAVVFDADLDTLLGRIAHRRAAGGRDVPALAVKRQMHEFTEPHYDEGFDQIIRQKVLTLAPAEPESSMEFAM